MLSLNLTNVSGITIYVTVTLTRGNL